MVNYTFLCKSKNTNTVQKTLKKVLVLSPYALFSCKYSKIIRILRKKELSTEYFKTTFHVQLFSCEIMR